MTTIGPKKDGGPNVEYFQSPESLSQFDQIRVWLQKNCKKVSILIYIMIFSTRYFWTIRLTTRPTTVHAYKIIS